MIDLSLYKNHDWDIEEYDEYFSLSCKKCKYRIRERFVGLLYFFAGVPNEQFHIKETRSNNEKINIARKNIYTCEEVIIKNLIE